MALLDSAKYYEMEGSLQKARMVLTQARASICTDWKVFFESVLTEIRNGCFEEAEELVKESLKIHFATGRLWATLI